MSNLADFAQAAAWKHDNAPGIRFFERPAQAERLRKKFVRVGDFAMVWPEALGEPPTLETLEKWVSEWKEATK